MWPPSMGGLLEEERELSNGWWKANIVGGCGGKWGSLDRELDKSPMTPWRRFKISTF